MSGTSKDMLTKERWTCTKCRRVYSRKDNLLMHFRRHTGERPFTCSLCQRSFYRRDVLQAHVRTHNGERPFKCRVCKHSFAVRRDLMSHTSKHRDYKRYQCHVCGKTFSRHDVLNRHLRTHTKKLRLYECTVCGRSYKRQAFLRQHEAHCRANVDGGPQTETANISSAVVAQVSAVTAPVSAVTAPVSAVAAPVSVVAAPVSVVAAPVSAVAAPVWATTEGSLMANELFTDVNFSHTTKHAANNQYQCDVCRQFFSRKDSLSRHLRTHTTKLYVCIVCGRLYKYQGYFRKHEARCRANVHSGPQLQMANDPLVAASASSVTAPVSAQVSALMASISEATYGSLMFDESLADVLFLHTITEHSSYQCNVCHKTFTRKDSLSRHLRTHTTKLYVCIVCGRLYKYQGYFRKHEARCRANVDGGPRSETANISSAIGAPVSAAAAPISVATSPISVAASPISVAAATISVATVPSWAGAAPISVAALPNSVAASPISVATLPNSVAAASISAATVPSWAVAAPISVAALPNSVAASPISVATLPSWAVAAPISVAALPNSVAAATISVATVPSWAVAAPISVAALPNSVAASPISVATLPNSVAAASISAAAVPSWAVAAPISTATAPILAATATDGSLLADESFADVLSAALHGSLFAEAGALDEIIDESLTPVTTEPFFAELDFPYSTSHFTQF